MNPRQRLFFGLIRQRAEIVSIDLPSGLDPTTGEVVSEAVIADYTFACHLPKQGCFLGKGWGYAGVVHVSLFLLKHPSLTFAFWKRKILLTLFQEKEAQNKFQAGSVIALTGSPGMMGAASLACEAAYMVGSGYVRALLPESSSWREGLLPREVVKSFYEKPEDCFPYCERADAFLIRPGLGRTPSTFSLLDTVWGHLHAPAVVDADALFWLSTISLKDWDVRGKILTPHLGEAGRLFQRKITLIDDDLLRDIVPLWLQRTVRLFLRELPRLFFQLDRLSLSCLVGIQEWQLLVLGMC